MIADQHTRSLCRTLDHQRAGSEKPRERRDSKALDVAGYAADEHASDRFGFEIRKLVFERTYLTRYRLDPNSSIDQVLNFQHGARLLRRGEP